MTGSVDRRGLFFERLERHRNESARIFQVMWDRVSKAAGMESPETDERRRGFYEGLAAGLVPMGEVEKGMDLIVRDNRGMIIAFNKTELTGLGNAGRVTALNDNDKTGVPMETLIKEKPGY